MTSFKESKEVEVFEAVEIVCGDCRYELYGISHAQSQAFFDEWLADSKAEFGDEEGQWDDVGYNEVLVSLTPVNEDQEEWTAEFGDFKTVDKVYLKKE